jgi:hypothetical protein
MVISVKKEFESRRKTHYLFVWNISEQICKSKCSALWEVPCTERIINNDANIHAHEITDKKSDIL